MSTLRIGIVAGPLMGALWCFVLAITLAVALSLMTGDPFRPVLWLSLLCGAAIGYAVVSGRLSRPVLAGASAAGFLLLGGLGLAPIAIGETTGLLAAAFAWLVLGGLSAWTMAAIMQGCPPGALTRHEFEAAVIRFLTGFGYIFFTAIVLIPFFVMVMTSLKNQAELMARTRSTFSHRPVAAALTSSAATSELFLVSSTSAPTSGPRSTSQC